MKETDLSGGQVSVAQAGTLSDLPQFVVPVPMLVQPAITTSDPAPLFVQPGALLLSLENTVPAQRPGSAPQTPPAGRPQRRVRSHLVVVPTPSLNDACPLKSPEKSQLKHGPVNVGEARQREEHAPAVVAPGERWRLHGAEGADPGDTELAERGEQLTSSVREAADPHAGQVVPHRRQGLRQAGDARDRMDPDEAMKRSRPDPGVGLGHHRPAASGAPVEANRRAAGGAHLGLVAFPS